MAQPIPLRPDAPQPEAPLDSPEVLVINALLDTGEFRPARYGLRKDMLSCYDKVWQHCEDYQEQVGHAPPRELVGALFPDFEQLEVGSIEWAADRLREAAHERALRRTLQGALAAIHDKDLDTARHLIAEAAKPSQLARPKGLDLYDPTMADTDPVVAGYPVPFPTLQKVTGGFAFGEVVTVGARFGEGKSFIVPHLVLPAAELGHQVAVLSCEMPKRSYIRRMHTQLAAGDPQLQKDLRSPDKKIRFAALDRLPRLKGGFEVLDPSDTRMTIRAVENLAVDHKVIVIDHIGLLADNKGRKAIEDWRVAAEISQAMVEIALAADVSIVQASQINREGETSGKTPPKASKLSGTDSLGQDAAVIITMARFSESVMIYDNAKNRSGFKARWYSEFLPATGQFGEISNETALQRALEDEARKQH